MFLAIITKYKFCDLLGVLEFLHKLIEYKSGSTFSKDEIKKALQDFIKRGSMRKKRSTDGTNQILDETV